MYRQWRLLLGQTLLENASKVCRAMADGATAFPRRQTWRIGLLRRKSWCVGLAMLSTRARQQLG
jgi:hypothetical protein